MTDIEHLIKILNVTNYQCTETMEVKDNANQSNSFHAIHFDDKIYRTHPVCVNVGFLSSMFRRICYRLVYVFGLNFTPFVEVFVCCNLLAFVVNYIYCYLNG